MVANNQMIKASAKNEYTRVVRHWVDRTKECSSHASPKNMWLVVKRLMKLSGKSKHNAGHPLPHFVDQDGEVVRSSEQYVQVQMTHFAEIAAAKLVSRAVLVDDYNNSATLASVANSDSAHCRAHCRRGHLVLDNVMDPISLEILLAKANPMKASTDVIPPLIHSLAPREFAALYHPLMAKTGLRVREPLKWKGSLQHPLRKAGLAADSTRPSMEESNIAQRTWRRRSSNGQ